MIAKDSKDICEYEWSLLHVWCGTDSVVWSCNSWLLSLAVSHCCAFVNQLGDSRQSFGSQRHVVGASSKSMKAVKATARLGSIVSRYTSARAQQRNWFIHIWEGFCMYITDRISFSVLKNSVLDHCSEGQRCKLTPSPGSINPLMLTFRLLFIYFFGGGVGFLFFIFF